MKKNMLLKLCIAASVVTLLSAVNFKEVRAEDKMKSAKEVASEMGIGWNLGNTFDSHGDWIVEETEGSVKDFETAWKNPVTTKAMIDKVKEAGFKTVRIPITWKQHMGKAPNYTVDEAWMDRINEVVDYVIDDGLYAIIDVHHDEEWCIPTAVAKEKSKEQLEALWTQIATRFKEYDSHLIFETLNEPRVIGSELEWMGGSSEEREAVNELNEAALKTIRSTGGNNKERAIMMPTYAASGSVEAVGGYKVSNDPNTIVSIHAYYPSEFALELGKKTTWDSEKDKAAFTNAFMYYYYYFAFQGKPVVLGEFGCIAKGNLPSRVAYIKDYVEEATKYGIPCILWDNGDIVDNGEYSFGIFDRRNLTWSYPEIKNAAIDTYYRVFREMKADVIKSSKDLELNVNKTEWENGYKLSFDIKNTSSNEAKGWSLKIKKGVLNIVKQWNVNVTYEGDYIIVKPNLGFETIAPDSSFSFNLLGEGKLDVLECELEQ